jgi:hypothetical protein
VYNGGRESLAPAEKKEIEFKLKLAKSANYSLIVVSDEEIGPIAVDEDEALTTVDGIVGQFVTIAETQRLLADRAKTPETEIEEIEDEVAAEINPIVRKQNEYCELCFGDSEYSSRIQYFYDPAPPAKKESQCSDYRHANGPAVHDRPLRVGCRVVIETEVIRNVAIEEIVWLRNFGSSIGWHSSWHHEISGRTLATDVAQYKALRRAFVTVAQSF